MTSPFRMKFADRPDIVNYITANTDVKVMTGFDACCLSPWGGVVDSVCYALPVGFIVDSDKAISDFVNDVIRQDLKKPMAVYLFDINPKYIRIGFEYTKSIEPKP